MKKRMTALILLMILPLCGCWDYRGLDELTIIAGIAIDKDSEGSGYEVSFEVVDPSRKTDDGQAGSYIVRTKGETINEAVARLNKKMHSNVSFSHAEIMIISQIVASEQGLGEIVDPFVRDSGTRDNMAIVISGEETAKKIFDSNPESEGMVSFDLCKRLLASGSSFDSGCVPELYQVYNMLASESMALTLPCIKFSENEEKDFTFAGAAVFEGAVLKGFLDDKEQQFFLLASTKLKGGAYNLIVDEQAGIYVSFAIRESRPRKSYEISDGGFIFNIDITIKMAAVDYSDGWGTIDDALLQQTQKRLEDIISRETEQVIEAIKKEFGLDVLGLGRNVCKNNPELWREISDRWQEIYMDSQIRVKCKVLIRDIGLTKDY